MATQTPDRSDSVAISTITEHLTVTNIVVWTLRVLLALFILLPLYNTFRISLTPLARLGTTPFLLNYFHWQNYVAAFNNGMLTYTINSIVYATVVTIINLVVAVPAAYALSRYEFRGKYVFMYILLVTQMFAAILIVPGLYIMLADLSLINTYVGLIVPLTAITLALSVWLLKGFFDSIDETIEEAAMIDGCSRVQVIRQVILPLSAPGVLTAGIFTYIVGYSNFLLPLILLNDNAKLPVAVGIYQTFGNRPTPYSMIMAMTIIGIIPIFIIYTYLQNYIVEGLTSGGVKA